METEPRYIIFDTDMGSDDAWALQMLLIAEKNLKNVKILAITCVDGNTDVENGIKNTYRMLWGLNRTDISIHKGSTGPLNYTGNKRRFYHGTNGMSDIEVWAPSFPDPSEVVHSKSAVQAIRDLVMQYPKMVGIVAVGPLTNIALAAKTYPEILDNVREIFIMGGNIKDVRNSLLPVEFNFWWDPEAAFIVLDSFKCPKTVAPRECCLEESLAISLDWRFNVLGKLNGPNMDFLNEVQRVLLANKTHFIACDAFLTSVLVFPECIRKKYDCYATVELNDNVTRGQMCINQHSEKPTNVTIIEYLNEEAVKKALIFAADATNGLGAKSKSGMKKSGKTKSGRKNPDE